MHKQEVTIYDVAREAKVSMATVSRVVNGNTNVRPETRDRVLEVIARLNYQPNAVAQGLASKRSTTIGLIVPDLTNLYFAELSKGIADIAQMYKYNIILSSLENRVTKESDVIQGLLNKQIDGVVYMSNRLTSQAVEAFSRTNTPVVLAGTVDDGYDELSSVNIDYEQADTEAFELMYQDGCRNIALVFGDPESAVNKRHRLLAYRKFIKAHNLTEHLYAQVTDYETGYQLLDRLKKDQVDGVFVTRADAVAGIVNHATDQGWQLPADLEVVCAKSTEISKVLRPKVTVVEQPLYDLGAVAMRMLTKLMASEELEQKNVILPHRLVHGATTKNLK